MVRQSPSRRTVLQAAGVFFAAGTLPNLAQGADTGNGADLEKLAEDAAIWGLPLVQTGRYIKLAQAKSIRWNQLYLNQTLATPSLKVPGPNIDTIYGFAWLDLSSGPLVLDVPDTADRYYSIQLMDAYENTFAYVGRRETGTKAGSYVIAGPDWNGRLPEGAKRIDSPTSVVFALTRTLVKGAADLSNAQNIQLSYTLAPLAHYPAGKVAGIVETDALNVVPKPDLSGSGAEYFNELSQLVRQYPPVGQEAVAFHRLDALGLGTGFTTNPPLSAPVLQTAFENALRRVRSANVTTSDDGWRVNYHIRKFIADPLVRANVDQLGPGAQIAEEAIYFSASKDSQGDALEGTERYTITFQKGQLPPVEAFWSLILYDKDFFLAENPLNRYSINDRTEGLAYGADGSLRILIQHDAPANKANWLPAPEEHFQLILRTYQPDQVILSQQYRVPRIVRVST
jgi:hypothetical protein